MSAFPLFLSSLATLVLGVVGALYLLLEWVHHRRERRFALLWSIGLFLLFWFQIPAILFNSGKGFTLTDFNLFFSFAFPTVFIGSLFIYAGILSVTRPPNPKRNALFILWVAVAAVLFVSYFANRNTVTDYSPTFIFIFGFFTPINILAIYELWRWRKRADWPQTLELRFGIAVLIASFLTRIFQDIYALDKLLKYPPEFWFLAIANSPALFIMQALGTLLLLIGFFSVHKNCCRMADGKETRNNE